MDGPAKILPPTDTHHQLVMVLRPVHSGMNYNQNKLGAYINDENPLWENIIEYYCDI